MRSFNFGDGEGGRYIRVITPKVFHEKLYVWGDKLRYSNLKSKKFSNLPPHPTIATSSRHFTVKCRFLATFFPLSQCLASQIVSIAETHKPFNISLPQAQHFCSTCIQLSHLDIAKHFLTSSTCCTQMLEVTVIAYSTKPNDAI